MSQVDKAFEEAMKFKQFLHHLHQSKSIIVLTGAGCSQQAGVPTFRGVDGVYSTTKAAHNFFDASTAYASQEVAQDSRRFMLHFVSLCRTARPTHFHRMIASLAREQRLLRLYTQNIDCLDTQLPGLATTTPLQRSPSGKWPKAVQLHGSIFKTTCSKRETHIRDMDETLFQEEPLPPCTQCIEEQQEPGRGGIKRARAPGVLRPRISRYNESAFDDEQIQAILDEDGDRFDLLIVAGTSLAVGHVQKTVSKWCKASKADGSSKITVLIDLNPDVAMKNQFDYHILGKTEEVAARSQLGYLL